MQKRPDVPGKEGTASERFGGIGGELRDVFRVGRADGDGQAKMAFDGVPEHIDEFGDIFVVHPPLQIAVELIDAGLLDQGDPFL